MGAPVTNTTRNGRSKENAVSQHMRHETSRRNSHSTPALVLVLVAMMAMIVSAGCKEEVPIEDRALGFIQEVTAVLTENADDPEKATTLINGLTQTNEPLLKELRSIDRREKSGKDAAKISEAAEQKLQTAIDNLMKAAMKEKIMKHKPLHEALKNIFQ
jgi:hypothetical protein